MNNNGYVIKLDCILFLLGLDVIVQSTQETEEAVASLKNIAAAHFIIVLAITGK